MMLFYEHAPARHNDLKHFRLLFVTAPETVKIIHAAVDEESGNAGAFRDHRYHRP